MENLESYITLLEKYFGSLPDKRTGLNCQYSMGDIAMSAFSVFFMQSDSWLEHQKLLEETFYNSNINTLFNIKRIPTDNHIRKMLDGLDTELFRPIFDEIYIDLKDKGIIENFKVLGDRILISIDGTEFFNSNLIHCDCCNTKYHKKNDIIEYYHTMVGFTICSPNTTEVIPLMPIFPENNMSQIDNKQTLEEIKQDNEYKSVKRLLENENIDFYNLKPIFLGDALYGTRQIIDLIHTKENSNFIIGCKPGKHKLIFEYVNACDLNQITVINRIDSDKNEKITYQFLNNIPLVNYCDGPRVNFISALVEPLPNKNQLKQLDKKAKTKSKNKKAKELIKIANYTFITDIEVNSSNIEELIALGRTRWRIENGFNSLKCRGYNFEHNFGHGKETLANVLATFMVLAFLIHTASKFLDPLFLIVRQKFSKFSKMIDSIQILTSFFIFDSFTRLFTFMADDIKIEIRGP